MYSETGNIFPAVLIATIILAVLVVGFIITIALYQKRRLALHKTRVRSEINALEKERARIAGDLHDDLGASLSAIKLKLQCLTVNDARETKLVTESESYIDEAMLKLKRISFNMMPQVLERKGLQQALVELAGMAEQTTPVSISLHYDCPQLSSEKTIHIYRIVQEALNNIVKHSGATKAAIALTGLNNKIVLNISDNGAGFSKQKAADAAKGQGLQNISARADALNAKMFLVTKPGAGVNYLFQIPLVYDNQT